MFVDVHNPLQRRFLFRRVCANMSKAAA